MGTFKIYIKLCMDLVNLSVWLLLLASELQRPRCTEVGSFAIDLDRARTSIPTLFAIRTSDVSEVLLLM